MSNPVQQYFAALNANPDDPEAVNGLDLALSEAEAWTDIAHTVPRFARGLSDALQRARFLFRAAFVARHYAQSDDVSNELIDEALTEDGLDEAGVASALVAAFEPTGAWRDLVTAGMDIVERAGDGPVSARIFHVVGQAYEDRLYERERAITCYQRAFKLDTTFVEPLNAARAIYAHAGQWSTVAKLYEIELRVTEEPVAQARLLKELGQVLLDRLGERERAIETLRRAAELDPELSSVRAAVAELESDGEAQGVIISPDVMEASSLDAVEVASGASEAVVADAPDEEVGTPAEAEAPEVDESIEADGPAEADESAEHVEDSESEAIEDGEVAAADEQLAGEDPVAAEAVSAGAESGADGDESEVEARTPDAEYGDGGKRAATESLDEGDGEGFTSPSVGPAAVTVFRQLADADRALDEAVARAGRLGDSQDGLDAWGWVLELGARAGREADELAGWVVDALSGRADGFDAVRQLLPSLLGRADVWALVAEMLPEQIAEGTTDDGALYAALFYGARDASAASRVRSRAGAAAEAEGAALEFAQKGNWRKAQAALQERHGSGDEAELDAYFEQAFLAVALDNLAKASDSIRRVLRKRKTDPQALRFGKMLYLAEEKWGPLAEAIRNEASGLGEDEAYRRCVAYRDLIVLYRDELKQPTNVLAAYKELVEVDRTDIATLDEYAALLEELNRPQELIPVLRMKADAVSDPDAQIRIHLEVASLFIERFNNQPEAISSYEAVLERDASNEVALSALEDLYEKRRAWESLIDVKRRISKLADDEETCVSKIRECAEIATTRMRDNDRAVALWNETLALSPDDQVALEALERLYERDKDWARLADVLSRRVGGIEDASERVLALIKLGQIQADRLGDAEGAITTYEELLALDPENFRAKDALKKAYIELERWDDLESFFAGQDAWADYVRQLESLAGSHDDSATQVALLFRAAGVWSDRLGDETRATKALERVLSVDETNYDAARQLAPVYEERGDFKRLPPLLEVILDRETEPSTRYDIQVKLARIARDRQRDEEAAFRWFSAALDEQPERSEIIDELEGVALGSGSFTSLVDVLTHARARIAGDEARQSEWVALSLRLGAVYGERIGDTDAALGCYDEVLSVDPANVVALDAKDAIFTASESWEALLEVLDAKVRASDDPAARVALLERACTIHEEQLRDPEAAALTLEEILEIEPENIGALDALHRLHKASEDAGALSGVLQRLIALRSERGEEEEARSLRLEYAELCIDALDTPAEAVATLRAVVVEEPRDPFARALLERLLTEDRDRLEVARLLAPLYEADGAWSKLTDVLEIEVEEFETPEDQVAILGRIGAIHREHLGDPHAATEAYARLLRLEPTSVEAQAAVESIAGESDVWAPLTELYEELIHDLEGGDETARVHAVALADRTARFFDEKLGETSEAIRMHRRVLEIEPNRLETMTMLEGLYERTERWEELLEALDERLPLTEDSRERRALFYRAARTWEEHLDSPSEAIRSYQQVLDLYPEDREALDALDRLYGTVGDSASRALVVEQLVELAGDDGKSRRELSNRLASIYEDDLGDVPRAMSLWQAVLSEDPRDASALRGLEGQLENDDFAVAASEILEPLYESQGDPGGLARLYEIRLAHLSASDERLSLYHRIATLHEDEAGDTESAYRVLLRAAEEFLGDASLLERLVSMATSLERLPALTDTLEELASESPDPEVGRSALVRVAGLRERSLDDVDGAARLWRQVLADNPVDREALDALQRIDEKTEDWQELVDVLLRKAELPDVAVDASLAKPLMFRAAGIYEQMLEQPDEGIEVLRMLLARDPSDAEAINQLERLYTQAGRWEDLVDNYQRKLDLTEDPSELRDLHATLGAVLEHELDDPLRAVSAYQAILAIDATDFPALQALERLYRSTDAWTELQDILERQSALVEDDAQRRHIRYQIGRIQESELMDFGSAVSTYAGVLDEDPEHPEVRAALQAMVSRGDEALRAARILEPIYRTEGRWTELIGINHTLIDSADTDAERRGLYVDVARVLERELGDVSGALDALSSAAREDTRSAELDEIERLAPQVDAWDQVVDLFGELWDEAVDPVVRSELGMRVARIRESRLGDVGGAIAAYVRILDEDSGLTEALVALDRLYARTEQHELLADVLQRRIFGAAGTSEALGLRLRLAALMADSLDDPAGAVSIYREVLAEDDRNVEALASLEAMATDGVETFEIAATLEPLYRQHGNWTKLVALHRARLATDIGPDERFHLWMDIADVLENRLGDKSAALSALGSAMHEMPGDPALKERLEALAEETDGWDRLAEIYGSVIEQDIDDVERLDVAHRLAAIHEGRLGDVTAAEAAYLAILDVEPAHAGALGALDRIYSEQGRWSELSSVLSRLREAVFDAAEVASLTFRHASLQRDRLGDGDAAIDLYQETLNVDPGHVGALDALVSLYDAREDWDALFETYERKSIVAGTESERLELSVKMATLATEMLDRPQDAVDLWRGVLAARPDDRQALGHLATLYEQTEQYNDLADVFDKMAELASDDAERVALHRRSGRLWAEVLDNHDQAITRYERIVAIDANDVQTLWALRDLYESVADFEKLVGVLSRLLDLGAVDTPDEAAVYRQLGAIHADTLMRPVDGIAAWREVLHRVPGDEEALERLEQLHAQQGDWRAVVSVLEQKVEATAEESDKIDLLKRIADLWTRELEDESSAARAFERVLDIDLADFDATVALEGIYDRSERWEELAGLSVDRLEVVEDPWERLQLLRRAADLYRDRLDKPDGAFVLLGTAALENPADPELRTELESLAEATGKYQDLVETYSGLVDRLRNDEPETAVGILVAMGRIQESRLDDVTSAEGSYEQALGIDPESSAAMDALEAIHTRAGSWASLVGVLRRRANVVTDLQEQVALHRRIGELFETRLDDTIEAVESYKMVLRLDDTDTEALGALERIHEASGEWRELIDVLERKSESTFEPAEQVAIHLRIGRIWQEKLSQPERAVESYRNVLDHDPGNLPALRALEALYVSLDKWERFLDVVDAQLSVAADDATRVELYAKQALVQEQQFDDVDAAIGSLLNILALQPKSLDALEGLERIYAEQERTQDLLDVLAQHVDATDDVAEKAGLLCRIGSVHADQFDDALGAIDAFNRALEVDAEHTEALERLGVLYEQSEQPARAVEAYERLAQFVSTPEERLRLFYRSGQLLSGAIGDSDAAAERFERCLAIDGEFVPAMAALEEIHCERGEWDSALAMLQNQIDRARELPARSRLMVRQAVIHGDAFGDRERAQHLYETAVELDPTNVAAAGPLAMLFVEQQEWARAWPLFELQLRQDVGRTEEEATRLYFNAGATAEQLGFDEQALSLYERVLEYEMGHLGSQRGLARLYARLGREEDAYQTYVDILAEHRSSMPANEAAECYEKAGRIKLEQGDLGEARLMFLNALEIVPESESVLRQMIVVVEESGDTQSAVDYKQRLLPLTSDDLERFKLLVELGDGYLDVGDTPQAEKCYRDAVQLNPSSKVVLHKLLNIFTSTGNWRRATEVLGQLARMEEDTDRHAKLCFTIAAIFRDELGELENAVEFYNKALDARFEYLEAFEAIDHLLTSARDWKALEQNYRRMLHRVEEAGDAASVELKVTLLKNLGEIYRSRLQRYDDAIAAYRLAAQYAPDDEVLLTILTELVEHAANSPEEVVEAHQRLIAVSPFRIESYRALFKAYLEARQFDEAWCMSSALSLLQKATPEEEGYYAKYLPKTVREARPNLTGAHWKERIYHEQLDRNLTTLFEILGVHLRGHLTRDHRDWGVHKKKDRIDLSEAMPVTKMLNYATAELGVAEIQLFQKSGHVGLVNMNVEPQAVLAGGDMFQNTRPLELAFQVAKAVTLMRPEFYLASAFPSTDLLKVFFFAAASAATGQLIGDGDTKLITEYAQEIRDLPPQVQEQVRRAVSAVFESGRNPDLSAWLRAVDHTASRVGLLLCGDLRTAVSCIKLEADRGQALSKADMKERVRELVLFNISNSHYALRRDLGLALQATK